MFTVINALIAGGCLAGLYVVVLLAALIGQHIWAWIDDEDKVGRHPITKFVMTKVLGFKDRGREYGDWPYKKPNWDSSCGIIAVILPLIFLALLPLIILGIIKLWLFATVIASSVALAFTARFVRRLSKKFSSHVEDKKAHN